MRPAVVFGGPSPEHDISILTGLQAARALLDGGVQTAAFYWSKSGTWHDVSATSEAADFVEGPPGGSRRISFRAEPGGGFWRGRRSLEVSVVLNACHGGPGEDGTLQAALDLAGVRYTGPGAAASSLGMDKLAFGAVVREFGLPSLPRTLLDQERRPEFDPPYIVKPRRGGSSLGIEVVSDFQTALDLARSSPLLREGALLEPFLAGSRDINVAVRTYPDLQLSALEAPVRSEAGTFYTYDQKYLAGGGLEGAEREIPAVLSEGQEALIRSYAIQLVDLIGLRSVARIDFLATDDAVWVNEVNTIPGSLAAYLWVDPPLRRIDLLTDMLAEAESQPPRQFTITGADGTALRSAASIAQKLG